MAHCGGEPAAVGAIPGGRALAFVSPLSPYPPPHTTQAFVPVVKARPHPTFDRMGFDTIWNSHPKEYGKGGRKW